MNGCQNGCKTPITEIECYAFYLKMGPSRSLRRLRDHLKDAEKPVSLNTLGKWSSAGRWVEKALEHDTTVGKDAVKAIHKQAVREIVTRADKFAVITDDALEVCMTALATMRDNPGTLRASDVKAISEIAVSCQRIHELLEGRATDRPDDTGRRDIDDQFDKMQKELEERLGRIPVYSGNA